MQRMNQKMPDAIDGLSNGRGEEAQAIPACACWWADDEKQYCLWVRVRSLNPNSGML